MKEKSCDENDDFTKAVFQITRDIPLGFVLTYGKIAMLAGSSQNSRKVGKLMSHPESANAHRVVNHAGRTVPGWTEQRELLENEGVAFKENGCVDLKKHLWENE